MPNAQKIVAIRKQDAIFDAFRRGLPHDAGWEQFILSLAIQYPARLPELVPLLAAGDFSSDRNRVIWTAIERMHGEGMAPNVYTLSERLLRAGTLETAGGLGFIAELHGPPVPDIPNIRRYTAILRDYAVRRQAVYFANELMLRATERECDTAEMLSSGAETLTRLAGDLNPETSFVTLTQSLQAQGGLNAYATSGRSADAIPSHIPGLGQMIPAGGFRPGDLVILAALTSRGKTAWALNAALYAARESKRVAYVSMEMDESSLFDRLISQTAGMDLYALRRSCRDAEAEQARRQRIREAVAALQTLSLHMVYAPGTTPAKMQSELRRLQASDGIDFVVVDYLQLMSGGGKFGTREQEVTAISRALKRMAADLGVPVMALSQFSRESAKAERRPRLDDLRESGAIEQDANLVLFIHFTRLWDMPGSPNGEAELIIAKQRNGAALGTLRMNFHAPTGVFTEIGV